MTKTVRDKQTNHIQTHKYKPDNLSLNINGLSEEKQNKTF